MSENKLIPIHNPSIILSLIVSSKEAESDVYAWRLVGGSKHLVRIKIESIRKSRNDIAIVPFEEKDPAVQSLLSGQSKIDIYVPETALMMRCEIKQSDAPVRYYVEIPKMVVQLERRKSLRTDCYDDGDVGVSFDKITPGLRQRNQYFKKNCFDIGPGGFSFLVSKNEAKYFDVGDQIMLVDVNLGEWATSVGAQITMIKEMEPNEYNNLAYKVWRVCCKYTSIDQESKNHLSAEIFKRIKEQLNAI